jgi:UDP:flavonoid glycosyltransferase YjiC (YdhE family)
MAAAAGVAIVPDTDAVTSALRTVLHDVSFANAARRVQAEIFAMPAPDTVAADLERLSSAGSGYVSAPS